jgi:hypothetical protein
LVDKFALASHFPKNDFDPPSGKLKIASETSRKMGIFEQTNPDYNRWVGIGQIESMGDAWLSQEWYTFFSRAKAARFSTLRKP